MQTVCIDSDFEAWWVCEETNAVFFNFRYILSDEQEARNTIRNAFGKKDIESVKAVRTNDGRCILKVIFATERARRTALERILLCKNKEVLVRPAVPSSDTYNYMVIRLHEIPAEDPAWIIVDDIEESVPFFFRHWEVQYTDFIKIEDIIVENISIYCDDGHASCEATVAIVLDGSYYIPKKDRADGEAYVKAYDDFFPFDVEYGYKTYCRNCKTLNGHTTDDCFIQQDDDDEEDEEDDYYEKDYDEDDNY